MLYDINIFVVDKNKIIKERLTAVSGHFNENIINLYKLNQLIEILEQKK